MKSSRRKFLGAGMAMAASGLYLPKSKAANLSLLDTAFVANILGPQTADLRLWLKADAITLNNNDPVATWPDSSGLGRDFTAAGAARPTFLKNQKNGLPGVSFDGVNHFMLGTTDATVTDYSMFLVLKMLATAGNPTVFMHGTATGAYLFILNGGNRNLQHRNATVPTNMGDAAANTTSFELWTAISTAAPASTFRVNAVGQTLTPSSGVFSSVSPGSCFLGVFPGPTLFANMIFCEILLYKQALNNANRNANEAYLMAKWGLP